MRRIFPYKNMLLLISLFSWKIVHIISDIFLNISFYNLVLYEQIMQIIIGLLGSKRVFISSNYLFLYLWLILWFKKRFVLITKINKVFPWRRLIFNFWILIIHAEIFSFKKIRFSWYDLLHTTDFFSITNINKFL